MTVKKKKGDCGDGDDHFEVKVADLVNDDGFGDGVVFVVIIYLNTEVRIRYWGSWQ